MSALPSLWRTIVRYSKAAVAALLGVVWALYALRTARRELPRRGVGTRVPPPRKLPVRARRGIDAVLRRQDPTCLERSLVLQAWSTARGVPRDVIVGVTRKDGEVVAHAWLEGDAHSAQQYAELLRLPPG